MRWLNELWAAVRETSFVAAQVITLGVVAMVLGLLALNALTHRPASPPTPVGPSRPLAALVPTLVPYTPTPTLATPPTSAAPATGMAPTPLPLPTERPRMAVPATPAVQATEPPPTATPGLPPLPSPTPAPASPTSAPPSPTSAVPGQLMKVLPASDGLPARVRAEPTTKSPILIRVPLGATVQVLGTTNGDELQPGNPKWVKVKWRDVTGYIYSTLVGEP